jgi:hypothetical protein
MVTVLQQRSTAMSPLSFEYSLEARSSFALQDLVEKDFRPEKT